LVVVRGSTPFFLLNTPFILLNTFVSIYIYIYIYLIPTKNVVMSVNSSWHYDVVFSIMFSQP
jgi:hypothetical protein